SGGRDIGEGGDTQVVDLRLLSQYPESGDENASALFPIELEFSTDVDPSTAEEAIVVRADGQEIEFSVTVDENVLEIQLGETPPLRARISGSVSTDLKSLSGGSYPGDTWYFDLPLWQRLEAGVPADLGAALAVGPGDLPTVLSGDSGLAVRSLSSSGWSEIQL